MPSFRLSDYAKRVQTGTGGGGISINSISTPITTVENTTTGTTEDLKHSIQIPSSSYSVTFSDLVSPYVSGEEYSTYRNPAIGPTNAHIATLIFNITDILDQIPSYGTAVDTGLQVEFSEITTDPSGVEISNLIQSAPHIVLEDSTVSVGVSFLTWDTGSLKSATFTANIRIYYNMYYTQFEDTWNRTALRNISEEVSPDKSIVTFDRVTGIVNSTVTEERSTSLYRYNVEYSQTDVDYTLVATPSMFSRNEQAGSERFPNISVGLQGVTKTTSYIYEGTTTIPTADRYENTLETLEIIFTDSNIVRAEITSYDQTSGTIHYTVYSDVTLGAGVSSKVSIRYRHRVPTYPIYNYYWALKINGKDLSDIASDSIIYINGESFNAEQWWNA